jgi:hypothetical protein
MDDTSLYALISAVVLSVLKLISAISSKKKEKKTEE